MQNEYPQYGQIINQPIFNQGLVTNVQVAQPQAGYLANPAYNKQLFQQQQQLQQPLQQQLKRGPSQNDIKITQYQYPNLQYLYSKIRKPKEKQNFQQEKYYKDKPADFKYLHQHGYFVTKELGRGGYGVVYKACEYRDGVRNKKRKFAIKINFQTVSPELIFSEIAFLTLLKGQPSTPQMMDLFTYEEKTHIVIEYFKFQPFIVIIAYTHLKKFFADSSMEEIKHYIYQMLLGVKTLKSMGIYHRDVKPGNFLYNIHEKKGILIDYGLSEIDDKFIENLKEQNRQKKDPEITKRIELYQNIKRCEKIVGKNKIGTESFMPLESILRYRDQGYQVDVWPIGVVFLQFLLKKYNIFNNVRMQNKPNQNKTHHNKSGQIKNTYFITFILELANIFGSDAVIELCRKYEYEVTLPNELPKEPINFKDIIKKEDFDDTANDLLRQLIALDQNDRISVEDAIKHPFFDSVRDYDFKKQQQLQQQKNSANQMNSEQQQQQMIKKNQQNTIPVNQQPIPQSGPMQNPGLMNPYQQMQFTQYANMLPMQYIANNPAQFQLQTPNVVHQNSFQAYTNKNLTMQPPK